MTDDAEVFHEAAVPQPVSGDYTDTNGEWVDVELYGKTGLFQSSITVALRVGFYGEENMGTAWFDDVVVERVAEVPAGCV